MPSNEYLRTVNRLCKWRTVFAGRWLGTRPATDPEAIAVRDVVDRLLILRVEVTAITGVLFDKGICTPEELEHRIIKECDAMQKDLEKRFPGFKATDEGMAIDLKTAVDTTKEWLP